MNADDLHRMREVVDRASSSLRLAIAVNEQTSVQAKLDLMGDVDDLDALSSELLEHYLDALGSERTRAA